MGAATRQATAAGERALDALARRPADLGDQLLAAARALASSPQLVTVLADVGVDADARKALVQRVFAKQLGAEASGLVGVLAAERWSEAGDLIDGVEQLGLRAFATRPEGEGLESELFAVRSAVSSDAQVELALGNQASPLTARTALVDRLLANAKPATLAIVRHVVALPRGRRIIESLDRAERLVADARGRTVAVVTTAKPLDRAQLERLERALAGGYGRKISLNQVIDPELVGGMRIAIGDDVIDGSIRARLDDLRLRLAG